MEQTTNFWKDKSAKIEIFINNQRLIFTAKNIHFEGNLISFIDRSGKAYSFPIAAVGEMSEW